MVPKQGDSVLYACTKFEADSSFRSKVIRGSLNFEIRLSRDPGHAHLVVVLYSLRRRHLCTKFEADFSIPSNAVVKVRGSGVAKFGTP